jgi:L-malate glycosyltransferase
MKGERERSSLCVIHVSTQIGWRGGEQQVAYLMAGLAVAGVRQEVVCRSGSAMERHCIAHNINHVAWPRFASIDPVMAFRLARFSKKSDATLIHAHDAHAHTMAVMAASLFGMNAQIIVSRRVPFPIGKGILSQWKYHHASVRKIICVSEAVRIAAISSGIDAHKTMTVHSGIDLSRFRSLSRSEALRSELGAGPNSILIGTVAALTAEKDLFTFLETIKRIASASEKPVTAVIAGEGPLLVELEKYASSLGISESVKLLGFRDDVPQLLASLDLFITTPESEGLGTSVLDAMAAGVPVVATSTGGIPEMVIDGQTGLLAPINDDVALGQHSIRILTDPQLADLLVRNAHEHLRKFSVLRMCESTLAIYRAALSLP